MPRGLKMSQPLIANMIPSVNTSNFFRRKNIYVIKFRVVDWDTLDGLAFQYARGRYFLG